MSQAEPIKNDLLASALNIADMGIEIIPLWWPNGTICACPKGAECSSPAKHPMTTNGLKDGTTDPKVITRWWDKWPNANVGLLTGGDIDVIDVDGAIPAYQQLVKDVGIPEHVAMVVTGRGDGGMHVYCSPGGNKTIPSGKHGLPDKIEMKGAGAYVVCPPSRHISGGTYTYIVPITGQIHGDVPLHKWLADMDAEPAPVVPLRPSMNGAMPLASTNVDAYRDAVIRAATDAVLLAGTGGRWTALATVAIPKICRGIAGGLIDLSIGIYALESAAGQAGLHRDEINRISSLVNIMLNQGIDKPIFPPADTNAATDSWLLSLPKDDAGALPEEYMEAAKTERTTWWPVELGPVLRGEVTEKPPEYLTFTDGEPLFYAGKVNGIIGESESGKTWIALHAVAQSLAANGTVLYMDFEDTAAGIVSRLKSLGVDKFNGLTYMSPDEGFGTMAKLDLSETLTTHKPDLVILDGFNAAMNVLGLDINSNNDATTFAQLLLKPVAATGVCLIYVDHVPKSKDARGKGGIGAQAKRAMTTGCTVAVQVLDPFGRGSVGRLALSVDKDRSGHVRGYCSDAKNLGTMVLNSDKTSGNIEVQFFAFDAGAIKNATSNSHRDGILEVLGTHPKGLNQGEIVVLLRAAGHTISSDLQKSTFQGLAFDQMIVRNNNLWQLNTGELGADDDD